MRWGRVPGKRLKNLRLLFGGQSGQALQNGPKFGGSHGENVLQSHLALFGMSLNGALTYSIAYPLDAKTVLAIFVEEEQAVAVRRAELVQESIGTSDVAESAKVEEQESESDKNLGFSADFSGFETGGPAWLYCVLSSSDWERFLS